MKNEIGRKLTSLTIMAIMFAGGLTIAAPSFMPEAVADFGATDGKLSVSSVYIQGAAILEVVVNDPDFADVDNDIANGPTVTIDGNVVHYKPSIQRKVVCLRSRQITVCITRCRWQGYGIWYTMYSRLRY